MSIDLQSRRSYFRFWMRRLLRFLTNPYHCQGFLLSTNFPFSESDHAFPSFFFKFRSISSHRFTRFQPISRGKRKTIIAPRWQEGKQFSSPVASIRWIFDFSTVRPCRTDISYERWNNYTGRVWGESRSAEGKRQFYAAGAPTSLATRWQPSFLLTIRPTKSTARPVFHGNPRCRRSRTLLMYLKWNITPTLFVAVLWSRAGVDGGWKVGDKS